LSELIQDIHKNVLRTCYKAGFQSTITLLENQHICFDIAASKNVLQLLLKVVTNADRLNETTIKELNRVASQLMAKPVIISKKRNRKKLEEGAVYERHGVPVISPKTLSDALLQSILPYVYVRQGGIFVKLDKQLLRTLREAHNLSLGKVAEILGVSRRTIYEYERGTIDPPVNKAVYLEDLFGPDVIKSISPFDPPTHSPQKGAQSEDILPEDEVEEQAADKLNDLGVNVIFARHAPFDAIAKTKDKSIITCIGQDEQIDIKYKVHCMKSLAQVLNKPSLLIVEEISEIKKQLPDIAIVELKQLDKLKDQKQLLKIIHRSGNQ